LEVLKPSCWSGKLTRITVVSEREFCEYIAIILYSAYLDNNLELSLLDSDRVESHRLEPRHILDSDRWSVWIWTESHRLEPQHTLDSDRVDLDRVDLDRVDSDRMDLDRVGYLDSNTEGTNTLVPMTVSSRSCLQRTQTWTHLTRCLWFSVNVIVSSGFEYKEFRGAFRDLFGLVSFVKGQNKTMFNEIDQNNTDQISE